AGFSSRKRCFCAALRSLTAIRERRFIVLPYNQATPGIGNAAAIETLVAGLHPRAPRP
ncbi:hypothetical protein ACV34A_33500, partial [Pseudomonas aeruginosa]